MWRFSKLQYHVENIEFGFKLKQVFRHTDTHTDSVESDAICKRVPLSANCMLSKKCESNWICAHVFLAIIPFEENCNCLSPQLHKSRHKTLQFITKKKKQKKTNLKQKLGDEWVGRNEPICKERILRTFTDEIRESHNKSLEIQWTNVSLCQFWHVHKIKFIEFIWIQRDESAYVRSELKDFTHMWSSVVEMWHHFHTVLRSLQTSCGLILWKGSFWTELNKKPVLLIQNWALDIYHTRFHFNHRGDWCNR